jgi:hypothetical protein
MARKEKKFGILLYKKNYQFLWETLNFLCRVSTTNLIKKIIYHIFQNGKNIKYKIMN